MIIVEWRHYKRYETEWDVDLGEALGIAFFSGENNECSLECVIDEDGNKYIPVERYEYPGVWGLVVDTPPEEG